MSDRLHDAPIGTKAPAIMGGHWYKNEHGWKWNGPDGTGSTFPNSGGDWDSRLIYPAEENAAPLKPCPEEPEHLCCYPACNCAPQRVMRTAPTTSIR